MSRELSEKLLEAFIDTHDMHMSYRELAVIAAKEIERLLADEREKVREMCAEVIAAEGRLWNRDEHPAVDDALHAVYVDIGKLDLTAPSST